MKAWMKGILVPVICGFLAFIGMIKIKPDKEHELIIWMIFTLLLLLVYEGLDALRLYRKFHKKKRAEDIRTGKRPIG